MWHAVKYELTIGLYHDDTASHFTPTVQQATWCNVKRYMNYRVTVSSDKYWLVEHINIATHSHTGNDEWYSSHKTMTLRVPWHEAPTQTCRVNCREKCQAGSPVTTLASGENSFGWHIVLLDVQLLSSTAHPVTVSFCSNTTVRTSDLYQTPQMYLRTANYVRQQTKW